MAPDWAYDAASWLQRVMDSISDPRDLVIGLALGVVATPLLILIHELGHAVAVCGRGLPLRQLKVGHASDFALEVGPLRIELGRLTGRSPVGGFVEYEDGRASPMDVLVIALAGPAASLFGALATGLLAHAWWGHGQVTILLVIMTLEGLWMAIGNLRPHELSDAGGQPTDGRWAQLALVELRRSKQSSTPVRTVWVDPNTATSVAPPSVPRH